MKPGAHKVPRTALAAEMVTARHLAKITKLPDNVPGLDRCGPWTGRIERPVTAVGTAGFLGRAAEALRGCLGYGVSALGTPRWGTGLQPLGQRVTTMHRDHVNRPVADRSQDRSDGCEPKAAGPRG